MRKKKRGMVITIHRTNIHNKKKKRKRERENYKHHKKKGE